MKTLIHITGKKLTLKFSPEGALSSARLDGKSVTDELMYVKKANSTESLSVFGFGERWEPGLVGCFKRLEAILEPMNFSILKVDKVRQDVYEIFLCSSKDTAFVNRTALMSLHYNHREDKFVAVVKTY